MEFSFSVPQSAVPVRAMMLNLIKAVDENAKLEELKGEEKDGSLEISGELEGGKYLLIVDKDGRLIGFEMDNNKLKMTFAELTLIDEKAPSASETTTESSEEATTEEATDEATTETTTASE